MGCTDFFLKIVLFLHGLVPAGIWCQIDVVSTSMRCNYVASTLIWRHVILRHVPAGVSFHCKVSFLLSFACLLPGVRERYCRTFATVMKRISSQMDTKEYSTAVLEFTVEHPNFEKLLKDVLFTTEDTYNFYIEIVSSCSALIEKYMSS